MHVGRAGGYDERYPNYQEIEARRAAFFIGLKKWAVRLVIVAIAIGAYVLYSIHNPVPDAVRNVANVDRREATKEAIELYAAAHPEYTEEEIEIIFRNIVH